MVKRSVCLCLFLLIGMIAAGCSIVKEPPFSNSSTGNSLAGSEGSGSESANSVTEPASVLPSSQTVSSGISSSPASSNSRSISSGTDEIRYSKPYKPNINTSTGFDENLTGKNVFLTFDDGPSNNNTPRILDVLKKYNIKATFFVCGSDSPSLRKLIKMESDGGHTVGIHCYSHDLTKLYHSMDNYWDDFNRIELIVHEVTGVWPSSYRFPGGTNNEYVRKAMSDKLRVAVEARGYLYYDWNVSSHDSSAPPAEVIIHNVLSDFDKRANAKGPSIVLMHDSAGRPTSADALETIIKGLIDRGCIFGSLNHTVKPVQFIKY